MRRRDSLRALLADEDADGVIVTSLPNIRYLTGFSGSNAALFISAHDPADDAIATDGRYAEQVSIESPELPVILDRSSVSALAGALRGHGVHRVIVESGIRMAELQDVREHLGSPRPVAGLVERLRLTKDAAEIERLTAAARITAEAFDLLAAELRVGWTEVRVARRLESIFGELGAEDRAFPTIVAAGDHAARPHHAPTSRPLAVGDLVIIDAGARVDGYHADMTRTFVVGPPAAWQEEVHACVDAAARAAREASVPGAVLSEVDARARDRIASAGWGEAFSHGLGHGVGLEIHEAPMIGPRSVGRLSASTSITIEPGVYLAGRGGVRIEDTLLVGQGEVLTEADRSLRPVG